MTEPTDTVPLRSRLAVAAALLLAAGSMLPVGCSSEAERARSIRKRGRSTFFLCKACGKTGKMRIGFDEKFPVRCPECEKVAAVGAFKCTKCGQIIEAQSKPVYRCPHCQFVYDNRLGGPGPGP